MGNKIWRNDSGDIVYVIDPQGIWRKILPDEIVVGDFFQQVDAVLTHIGNDQLPKRAGRSLHIVGRQRFAEVPTTIYPVIEVTRV